MPDTSVLPSVDQLFLRWKQFLDDGALTTATFVAGDFPELIDPLQLLINTYIAKRAAGVEDTLTAAALAESSKKETTPVLPGYTILGPLGEGGMGVVYRVRDPLDREWALKLARHGQLNEAGRERFHDEAKAMVRLHHPNVAPIHHYDFTANGRPFFLMPIYPGNLTARLSEYQADPVKAVRLMALVADGVGHLHTQGFVHRDLKPHNILLNRDGQPAVSDFGLVKSLAESASEVQPDSASGPGSAETKPSGARRSRTVAGVAVGTRAYMAPEQAAGLTHLSNPKWDVWALGVILHELVTGRRPPSSDAPQRLLDPKHADNPPPSIIKPGLDPRLEKIIQRCLARNENDRYADGQEVARVLRAWRPMRKVPRREKWVVLIGVVLIGLLLGRWAIPKWSPWHKEPSYPVVVLPTPPPRDPVPDLPDDALTDLILKGQPLEQPYWVLGEKVATVRPWGADKATSLDTQVQALYGIVPARDRDSILISARVRMNERTLKEARASVYAGATSVHTNHGPYQAFIEVGFCDERDNDRGESRTGIASLSARLVGIAAEQVPPMGVAHFSAPMYEFTSPVPRGRKDEPYHDLTLELTTTHVRGWLDSNFVGQADVAGLAESLQRQIENFRGQGIKLTEPIVFQPSGGAGLYVARACASYERFRAGSAPQRLPE